MKRLSIVTAVLLMALAGCQESKEMETPLSEKDFYKTIGEQIPFETGMEWLDLYRKTSAAHGRVDTTLHYHVPAEQLRTLLTSTTDLVGVAFHHATDGNGQHHILAIPVDQTMSVWSSDQARFLVDANTGTEISLDTASVWAENYKNAYPEEKWFHFFGKEIFDEMVALPYFTSMEIEPAISSIDYTPQLLLMILENAPESTSSGRLSGLLQYGVVYDASNACPPCAVY